MSLNIEELAEFTQSVQADLLGDLEKENWSGKNYAWYLSQLAKEVNALERALVADKKSEIVEKAVSVAGYAFILNELAGKQKVVKKKATRKRTTSKKKTTNKSK